MSTPHQQAHWTDTWVHLNLIVQADAPLDIFAVSKIMHVILWQRSPDLLHYEYIGRAGNSATMMCASVALVDRVQYVLEALIE